MDRRTGGNLKDTAKDARRRGRQRQIRVIAVAVPEERKTTSAMYRTQFLRQQRDKKLIVSSQSKQRSAFFRRFHRFLPPP
jgi:hypothetical protein